MKKLQTTLNKIENILKDSGIEPNEAKIEAKMLVRHFLNVSDTDIILDKEIEDDSIVLEKAKERATSRKPIQHVIGSAYFMGEDFIVNENVLIPRDETELLVRKAVELLTEKKEKGKSKTKTPHPLTNSPIHLKVLDIGTGSGCIACMIAKLTGAQVLGIDVSTDALQVALDNSSRLNLCGNVMFRKSDVFSKVGEEEKFDMIISNPPYIPPSEKGKLQKEVEFDPELALFASDEEGVEFYKKISENASKYLNPEGFLLFELGIGQADLVKKFMEENGFKNVQVQKDLAGIDRVIWGNI